LSLLQNYEKSSFTTIYGAKISMSWLY